MYQPIASLMPPIAKVEMYVVVDDMEAFKKKVENKENFVDLQSYPEIKYVYNLWVSDVRKYFLADKDSEYAAMNKAEQLAVNEKIAAGIRMYSTTVPYLQAKEVNSYGKQ